MRRITEAVPLSSTEVNGSQITGRDNNSSELRRRSISSIATDISLSSGIDSSAMRMSSYSEELSSEELSEVAVSSVDAIMLMLRRAVSQPFVSGASSTPFHGVSNYDERVISDKVDLVREISLVEDAHISLLRVALNNNDIITQSSWGDLHKEGLLKNSYLLYRTGSNAVLMDVDSVKKLIASNKPNLNCFRDPLSRQNILLNDCLLVARGFIIHNLSAQP
jgi:hypothetical protein